MYFLTIFSTLNMSGLMMFWLMLEINMLTFIVLMYSIKSSLTKESSPSPMMMYLCVQILGSTIMILMFFSTMTGYFNSMIMMAVISLKMGIFPFHSWMFKISKTISMQSLVILLTVQKIPLVCFVLSIMDETIFIILLMNLVMGVMFLYNSKDLMDLVIGSSIYSTVWFVGIMASSMSFLILYVVMYSTHLYMLFLGQMSFSKKVYSSVGMIGMMMFLAGLPPFSMFFFKLTVFGMLLSSSFLFTLTLWAMAFSAVICYVNYFSKSLLTTETIYHQSSDYVSLWIFPVAISLIFFVF